MDCRHQPFFDPEIIQENFVIGARQFVVQEALETIVSVSGLYVSSLTPMTKVGMLSLPGAEIMTRSCTGLNMLARSLFDSSEKSCRFDHVIDICKSRQGKFFWVFFGENSSFLPIDNNCISFLILTSALKRSMCGVLF